MPEQVDRAHIEVDRAYVEACRKGTKQVYNARIILAGYSGGGKTSLANRLLGKKINVDERNSTEGVALHRIESIFNRREMKGAQWDEKELNSEDLKKEFNLGLVAILQGGIRTDSIDSAETERMESHTPTKHYAENEDEDTKAPINKGSKMGRQGFSIKIWKKFNKPIGRPRPVSESRLHENPTEKEEFALLPDQTREEIMGLANKPLKQESEENTPFSISLWDLGGQDEFISTHHLFLNIEATILIVMDITKELYELIGSNFQFGYLNSAVDVLHYWLNFFHNAFEERKGTNEMEPNVALVLTHKDQLSAENREKHIEDYKTQILEAVEKEPYAKYVVREKIYVVDNSEETEENFGKLRNGLLRHLEQQKSWGKEIPLPWLSLKADIIEEATVKNKHHLSLSKVWALAEKYKMNTKAVNSFLEMQSVLGDFVYFPNREFKEIVITDPRWLVDKCSALISTHEFIDNREGLEKSIREDLKRGKVTEDGLKVLWNNDKVVYLTKLMEKFDLLVNVSNKAEHKYIIPCMLRSKRTRISQKEIPYRLLIGSFPQLVSKCSKERGWELSPENLSYTTASFNIRKGMKLHLSLTVSGEVQTSIDWPDDIKQKQRTVFQGDVTTILSRILKTCRNQTNPDEGNLQLLINAFWF